MPRGGSPPAPSAGKSATRTAQKTALCAPCEHPGGFGIRKSASNSGHSPLRGLGVGLGDDQGTDRPMAALHFLLPTGDSRSGRRSLIPNSSPFSRSTRFPFTSTASPPAPLAIRTAPSTSVESIQPRPPQPCEVGRQKGRRRKNRRQPHNFFLAPAAPPQLAARPWGGSPPRPLCQKICYQTAQKTALCAPASTQEVSESENPPATGHSPLRCLRGGLGDASPARRCAPSRTPLRRP